MPAVATVFKHKLYELFYVRSYTRIYTSNELLLTDVQREWSRDIHGEPKD